MKLGGSAMTLAVIIGLTGAVAPGRSVTGDAIRGTDFGHVCAGVAVEQRACTGSETSNPEAYMTQDKGRQNLMTDGQGGPTISSEPGVREAQPAIQPKRLDDRATGRELPPWKEGDSPPKIMRDLKRSGEPTKPSDQR